MTCISSARYDCTAVILKESGSPETRTEGDYAYVQDPISGSISRTWAGTTASPGGILIDCAAKGFVSTGIHGQGTEAVISEKFYKRDMVRIEFSSNIHLTDKDKVTEIRYKKTGQLIWREEEREILGSGEWTEVPTVFNVIGVTPVIQPFVGHIENSAMLERSEVQ